MNYKGKCETTPAPVLSILKEKHSVLRACVIKYEHGLGCLVSFSLIIRFSIVSITYVIIYC